MSSIFALSLLALGSLSVRVAAQQSTYPATPLASKRFAYPTGIPYKVDTEDHLIRGRQSGYNICNSTTQGQTSLCQTSFLNSLDDFCLWAPINPNSEVGNVEGDMVAWCTKPGHGTRLIPANALQGVQFIKTPDYVQVAGFIDQTKINILEGDFGGEMDPHGADLRGNPLGGLFYSNAWSADKTKYNQVIEWHNFIGGNSFCFKACDPAGPNAAKFCEHIYDRIGCAYNAPNAARNGTFESCDGENQDFPGHYIENGVTVTYKQPAESLGPISSMPYTARVPASSNCVDHTSSVLYAALASVIAPEDNKPTTTPSGSSGSASSGTAKPTGSGSGTSGSSATGSAANPNASNEAGVLAMSGVATIAGIIFSAMFFA